MDLFKKGGTQPAERNGLGGARCAINTVGVVNYDTRVAFWRYGPTVRLIFFSASSRALGPLVILITALFYTLFERKLLRSAHIRRGPVIVGPGGLLQPVTDVLKLLTKSRVFLTSSN